MILKKYKYMLFLSIITLFGCGFEKHNETIQVADSFLKLLKNNNYEEAYLLTSSKVLDNESYDLYMNDWEDLFNRIHNKFGVIEQYSLKDWELEYIMKVKDQPDGIYYKLDYDVIFSESNAGFRVILYKKFFDKKLSIHDFSVK